jgi:hypothetical protein
MIILGKHNLENFLGKQTYPFVDMESLCRISIEGKKGKPNGIL